MINKTFLIGNLGTDFEIKTFNDGSKLARARLATNKSYRDNENNWQEITQWHTLVVKNGLVDYCKNYKKKDRIYVEGEINYRNYQNKNNETVHVTEIIVHKIHKL